MQTPAGDGLAAFSRVRPWAMIDRGRRCLPSGTMTGGSRTPRRRSPEAPGTEDTAKGLGAIYRAPYAKGKLVHCMPDGSATCWEVRTTILANMPTCTAGKDLHLPPIC